MVVYLAAFLLFAALSGACWVVSVALFRGTVGGPDPAATPHSRLTAALAVGAAALTSFVQYPTGYSLGLVGWAEAVFCALGLSAGRAVVLFLYLAASSFAARLMVLGVMDLCRI